MKRFMIDDLYEILGVFRDATPEQIRSRYLALRIADENVRLPRTWFAEIKRAYSTLSNPVQREISDNLVKVKSQRGTTWYCANQFLSVSLEYRIVSVSLFPQGYPGSKANYT